MNPTRLYFHVTGGIGDLIIALPLLEALREKVGPQYHYVFYANFPELLTHFLPWATDVRSRFTLDKELPDLKWWLEVTDLPRFRIRPGMNLPPEMNVIHEAWLKKLPSWGPLIGHHPGLMNQAARQALQEGLDRYTIAPYLLGLSVKPFRYVPGPVNEFALGPHDFQPFITVHDGFDATGTIKARASNKNWLLENWEGFTGLVRRSFPEIKIFQLGNFRSRKIPGADHRFVGKIPFPESIRLLAQAALHIDGDSGLVHARHLFKLPSVVLFGPTESRYFGYPENLNIASPVCNPCWWQKADWMTKCLLGAPEPPCMKAITPLSVFEACIPALSVVSVER